MPKLHLIGSHSIRKIQFGLLVRNMDIHFIHFHRLYHGLISVRQPL
ncbi:unnamed protein product [Schistosoma mattheei]|uniref:Uncharacterized protein n=1 Tax=Schistosoma mattheei TaxID=31246 RepID=A0A183PHH5_9TREM|nr:unnamed protein product [Schistosoma mattheei]